MPFLSYDYDATESCIMCIYINDMLRTNGRREAPIEDGEPAGNIHIHINKLQHSCSKIRVNLVPIAIFNSLSIFSSINWFHVPFRHVRPVVAYMRSQ